MPVSASRSLTSRSTMLGLLTTLLIAVGMPLAVAIASGSLSIPHNDSWSYSLITQAFARTGRLRLLNWNRTALIGQVVMLGPLGSSIFVQQLAVAILGIAALLLTYRLIAARTNPSWALFGTATVAAFPGFGLLATSYMTDIPGLFAMVAAITLCDAAINRHSLPLFFCGLAVGVFGAAIREQNLAALAALALAAWAKWPGERRAIATSTAVSLLVFGAFEVWRHQLAFGDPGSVTFSRHIAIWNTIQGTFTFTLLAAPVAAAMFRRIEWNRPSLVTGIGLVLLGLGAAVHLHGQLFLGSYIAPGGAYAAGNDNGSPGIFPMGLMDLLVLIALASSAVLPAILWQRARRLDPLLAWFAVLLVAGSGVEIITGQGIQDRYLIPLVIPFAVLCGPAAHPSRPERGSRAVHSRKLAGISVLVLLILFSAFVTVNALLRDAAQWDAGQALVAAGVPAQDVNAGFDWVGFHAHEPAVTTRGHLTVFNPFSWKFPNSLSCFAVTMVPLADRRPVAKSSFRTYGLFGRSTVYTYKLRTCVRVHRARSPATA